MADIILDLNNQSYPVTRLGILRDLCADAILGQDFQRLHLSVKFEFDGPRAGLTLNGNDKYCALTAAACHITADQLLPNLDVLVRTTRPFLKMKFTSYSRKA